MLFLISSTRVGIPSVTMTRTSPNSIRRIISKSFVSLSVNFNSVFFFCKLPLNCLTFFTALPAFFVLSSKYNRPDRFLQWKPTRSLPSRYACRKAYPEQRASALSASFPSGQCPPRSDFGENSKFPVWDYWCRPRFQNYRQIHSNPRKQYYPDFKPTNT